MKKRSPTRVGRVFEKASAESRAALIIYVCGGDPSLAATTELLLEAQEAGADIIELGVPFSDPSADGPTIEHASSRALQAGATFSGVLLSLTEARRRGFDTPVVLFGYYNPILARGEAQAIADAKSAGVDGFLVVDLPPEEAGGFIEALDAQEMAFVPLVAPTSGADRIHQAATLARDFVYYVSMTGVTGKAAADLSGAAQRASQLTVREGVPFAVGFGVRSTEDVRAVAAHADGVVVGSAVVQRHYEKGSKAAGKLIRDYAEACRPEPARSE